MQVVLEALRDEYAGIGTLTKGPPDLQAVCGAQGKLQVFQVSIPESSQQREGLLPHFLCGQGQMLLLLPGGTNGKGNVHSFVGCLRERTSHYSQSQSLLFTARTRLCPSQWDSSLLYLLPSAFETFGDHYSSFSLLLPLVLPFAALEPPPTHLQECLYFASHISDQLLPQ